MYDDVAEKLVGMTAEAFSELSNEEKDEAALKILDKTIAVKMYIKNVQNPLPKFTIKSAEFLNP